MQHAIQKNGVMVVRTPMGLGVMVDKTLHPPTPNKILTIEITHLGRPLKIDAIQSHGPPWRDYFGDGINHLDCGIRVKDGGRLLAELKADNEPMSFMVRQGEQHHITESYVAIPPALTITDEVGAVWTLGFKTAEKEQSPKGEYAFNVLRDGVDMKEIASRIERVAGKVRIFTKHGWKIWNNVGCYFF